MRFKDFTGVLAPLLSMFILMNGLGALGTFIPVRLEAELVSSWDIGLITSAYYAGMVLGAFRNAHFILRVGHIRAYAAFASLISVTVLCQGLFYDIWYWVAIRAICGYCLSGLYIVVESWMLGKSTVKTRGQFLSLYMISLYGALALGQFLLNIASSESLVIFAIITILASMSVIPVAITKAGNPAIEEPTALTFLELYKISPSGVISCACAGLFISSALGMLPLYTQLSFDNIQQTSIIMFCVVFGGMALQYPLGHISDHMDRRKMLISLCATLVIISCLLVILPHSSMNLIYVLMFIFGGAVFTIYPVSISHTSDVLDPKDFVSAIQGLTLAYGLGAVIGPTLVSLFMALLGAVGVFVTFTVVASALGVYLLYRTSMSAPVKEEDQQDFVAIPVTTPVASELDPRSE